MNSPVSTERKLAVTVVYNGDPKELRYQPHESVHALLEHAKQAFGVVGNHLLALFDSSGAELADSSSLESAGVKPGDTLVLGQSVIKGG